MTTVEIMDITKTCRSFPEAQVNTVDREHLIGTIDKIFEGDTNLLVIEGPEGIGKTTLLAHFAKRHADRIFCLFIKPTSRLAYLPEYLRLTLSEQIHWALYGELLASESVDESFLHTKLPLLQREALASRKPFYFVVDGLADIPRDDAKIEGIILRDVLPLGLSGFKFLISGDLNQIDAQLRQSLRTKSFPLPNFSLDETAKFLHDITVGHDALLNLHRMCSGVPGHLAIVKRMITSGATPQSILDEDASNLPEFIGIEWRKLAIENQVHGKLLAALTFAHQILRIEDLARILNEDVSKLEDFVKSVCLVSLNPHTREVQFVSEAHRKFAAVQLQEYRDEITQRLIDDLLTDVQSQEAVSYLPTYYEEANRLAELLDYLTPDHFINLLSQSQSLLPVYRRTELGFVTAEKTDREGQLTKFSLQMAIVKELSQAAVWRAEIEARIGLQDYDAALALARNTLLREDRLHLLAKIARGMHEKRVEPGQELLEQIRSLYHQVDPKTLDDRAVEIASDLVYSFPDLAVELIEATSSTAHTADRLDLAFAHLSVAALGAKASRPDGPDAAKAVQSKIRDPRFHQFFVAASLLIGGLSAAQVIDEVEKMEFKNRVFFLRQWLLANTKKPDAVNVIETALDTLIKDGLYTPKTRDLLEIATPLPFVEDVDRARKLVGRLDSQKATVEHLGSSEDYVRLQLILAQTEQKYDFAATQNRVVEVYWFISNLDDLVVRTDCLAWLVTYLEEIDPLHVLEAKEGIHSLSQDELKQSIEKILSITAEHSLAARGAVRALSTTKPDMALELANSLNTVSRRDEARQEFIDRALEASWDKINVSLIGVALDRMESSDTKNETIVKVFQELSDKKPLGQASTIEACLSLIIYITQITDAHQRTRASAFAYLFLNKQQVTDREILRESLLAQLEASWQAIDVGWLKVRTGFRIARALAEVSNDLAHSYLAKTEKIRDEIIVDDESLAHTYFLALKLVIRAYSGLLPRHLNSEQHVQRLELLINRLPANGERAGLWADLAVRHGVSGQIDMCQRIITKFVRPLIEAIDEKDAAYKQAVVAYCGPALYYSHRITALEMIRKLPSVERDMALSDICKVILRKQPASDAYDDARHVSYSPSYESLVDICDLLKLMEEDSYINHYITLISDVLSTRRNRDRFTKQQKADLAFRLRAVVDSKLPDQRNITHQGYRICCEAHIERILQSPSHIWDRLMESARQVPNMADRALVLCTVGTTMSRKLEEKRRRCIDEAIAMVDTIPTALDAADRYSTFADLLTNVDLELAKKCLRRGMEVSVKINDPQLVYPKQRRIIDLAHKLDPSLAASLASLLDNDPARTEKRDSLKERIRLLDLRKEMAESEEVEEDARGKEAEYSSAAWMNLGALNAGRLDPVHFHFFRNHLKIASQVPISQAYSILAWIIENGVKRLGKTDQAETHLLPLFDAVILGAELAGRIITKSLGRSRSVKTYASNSIGEFKRTIVINPGERERVIEVVKQWLSDTVGDYLKISDPYFGIHDLEVLRILRSVKPSCPVHILTSKKQQLNDSLSSPWEDAYRTHWRLNISDQDPPNTEIVIVGNQTQGASPIHDRWWVTNNGGLCMGTSFNSLGITKSSELRTVSAFEAEQREKEIDKYLNRQIREFQSERLFYSSFTL